MSKSVVRLIVVALAVLALVLPSMAKPVTKTFSVSQPFKIGNTELQAGEYKLVIDGDKVTVQQGKQVVATATIHWEQMDKKSDTDCVTISADGVLQKICFFNNDRAVVFGGQ